MGAATGPTPTPSPLPRGENQDAKGKIRIAIGWYGESYPIVKFRIDNTRTMGDEKNAIQASTGIIMLFRGKKMQDDKTLQGYKDKDGSTLKPFCD